MTGALQHREVDWEGTSSALADEWWIGDLERDELHRTPRTCGPKVRRLQGGRAGGCVGVCQGGLWVWPWREGCRGRGNG